MRAAKAQYDEGERAFKKGDFRRAAELFENAYRILPHHSPLWNAARSWIRAGEDVRGANLLERYLKEAPPNAPDRDRATEAITDLDKRLGRIEVLTNDVTDVKIDGEALDGDKLWVVPGEHVATADAHGKPVRKTVSVAAGDRVSVTLEPPPPPETMLPPPPPPKPLPRWVVFAGAGVSVVGGGLVALSGIDTLNKKDDVDKYISSPTFNKDDESQRAIAQNRIDDAASAQTRTNVAIGVTVGVAVLTAVAAVFFVDWDKKPTTPTTGYFLAPPRHL